MNPIDKTKKSNRRCSNCACWDSGDGYCNSFWSEHRNTHRYYYNCCQCFEWNPDKKYKENNDDSE